MINDPSDRLLEQLWQGNIEVLGDLFAAYESYLRAIVRSQLSDNLRSKFDSVDVVQSVWVQLLRKMSQDGCRVNDKDHLRALLVTIARRRLVTRAHQCRGQAQVEISDNEEVDPVSDFRQPKPSEMAQADDLWTKMLTITPPDHHTVLHLKREGVPLQEIARRTGLHEGSVRRILRKLSRELALREEPFGQGGSQ